MDVSPAIKYTFIVTIFTCVHPLTYLKKSIIMVNQFPVYPTYSIQTDTPQFPYCCSLPPIRPPNLLSKLAIRVPAFTTVSCFFITHTKKWISTISNIFHEFFLLACPVRTLGRLLLNCSIFNLDCSWNFLQLRAARLKLAIMLWQLQLSVCSAIIRCRLEKTRLEENSKMPAWGQISIQIL